MTYAEVVKAGVTNNCSFQNYIVPSPGRSNYVKNCICTKLRLQVNSLNTLFFFKFPARQTHNVCQNNVRNPHVHGYELEIKHTLCVLVVKICKRVNVLFWPALTPGTWRIIQNVLHSSFVAANCLLGSKFVLLHVHVHVCWALMWKEHN